MAGASLLTLLDDIASVLDDVAVLTKVAAKRTAGVLGDDLAVNAYQVGGVRADRELPVVWAVARGSLRNKALLVPAALALNAFLPWALTPLLLCGGAYLCFEAFEKLLARGRSNARAPTPGPSSGVAYPTTQQPITEAEKIAAAIRTDLILSAEIIVITLGTVATATFPVQAAVLTSVALLMTVGVYGLVAGIVRLDDAGIHLAARRGTRRMAQMQRRLGRALLQFAPRLMKALSFLGTAAMFLVGGGIVLHSSEALASALRSWETALAELPLLGSLLLPAAPILVSTACGVMLGALLSLLAKGAQSVQRAASGRFQ